MKNIFKSIFVVLLATFLVGCDDFEDDVEFQIDSSSTKNVEYEVLGTIGQNALKVKVTTYINVTEQKNVSIERADIHLYYFKEYVSQASVEKVSDSLYKCTAIFESIPMPSHYDTYSVWTNVKGNYLDARVGANSITINRSMLVRLNSVEQVLSAPDTIVFKLKLGNIECLNYGDYVLPLMELYYEKEDTARQTDCPTLKNTDIRSDGTVEVGWHLGSKWKSGNYRMKVRLNSNQKECSVVVPKSTATFKNVQAYVDVTGLHVKGDFDKGNLLCDPYLVVEDNAHPGGMYIKFSKDTKNVNILGGYPPYNTNYAIKTKLVTAGHLDLGVSNSFTVKSNYSRYGIDMGGDVLWANDYAYNDEWITTQGSKKWYGYAKYDQCKDGDGDWRLPTTSEVNDLVSKSNHVWQKSTPVGMRFFCKTTGNELFVACNGFLRKRYSTSSWELLSTEYAACFWIDSSKKEFVANASGYAGVSQGSSDDYEDRYNVRYVLPKSKADIK